MSLKLQLLLPWDQHVPKSLEKANLRRDFWRCGRNHITEILRFTYPVVLCWYLKLAWFSAFLFWVLINFCLFTVIEYLHFYNPCSVCHCLPYGGFHTVFKLMAIYNIDLKQNFYALLGVLVKFFSLFMYQFSFRRQ